MTTHFFTGGARLLDAIPTVGTTAERDARFPFPVAGFKVYNVELRAVQRYTGSAWTIDAPADSLSAATFGFLPANTGAANLAALQAAMSAASGVMPLVIPPGSYTVAGTVALPANLMVYANGATITQATSQVPLLQATAVDNITLRGGRFVGVGASTPFADGDAGLLYFVNSGSTTCDSIRLLDLEVDTAYQVIGAIRCQRIWVERCYLHTFERIGLQLSKCVNFWVRDNVIEDCTQTGGVIAYGITAQGDAAGGVVQERNAIINNVIRNIPSWDAIGSHDLQNVIIAGNIIHNVRRGIDLGHLSATNVVQDLIIANNRIELTQTDTWGGAGADHGGIQVVGYDATHRCARITITGNLVYGAYRMTGGACSGIHGSIVVSMADDVSITGNSISGVGAAIASGRGLVLQGTLNRIAVNGNTLEGAMDAGAIRGLGVAGDLLTIVGNIIKQTTASVEAILFSGSSAVTNMAVGKNPSNSTVPFSLSSSTASFTNDTDSVSVDRGDANVTLTAADARVQRWATTLTADRTVTLPTTAVFNGMAFRVVRTGLGAFTLDVGGLKTIGAATAAFVDVMYDGANWRLIGYGPL